MQRILEAFIIVGVCSLLGYMLNVFETPALKSMVCIAIIIVAARYGISKVRSYRRIEVSSSTKITRTEINEGNRKTKKVTALFTVEIESSRDLELKKLRRSRRNSFYREQPYKTPGFFL